MHLLFYGILLSHDMWQPLSDGFDLLRLMRLQSFDVTCISTWW